MYWDTVVMSSPDEEPTLASAHLARGSVPIWSYKIFTLQADDLACSECRRCWLKQVVGSHLGLDDRAVAVADETERCHECQVRGRLVLPDRHLAPLITSRSRRWAGHHGLSVAVSGFERHLAPNIGPYAWEAVTRNSPVPKSP